MTDHINAREIADFVASLGIEPGEVDRIICHWTAGGAFPNQTDRRAYNVLLDQSLKLHQGTHSVEDQANPRDGIYGRHTGGLNTRSLGFGLCGMSGAKESPFDPGPVPVTEAQFKMSAVVAAYMLRAAGLPVAPHTAMTHAEVPRIMGIEQPGKWDIKRLAWRDDLDGAQAVGDYWRTLIREAMQALGGPMLALPLGAKTLRRGSQGDAVKDLQRTLRDLGYFAGNIDGKFGPRTHEAVLAFQAENRLADVDGIVGPRTREALMSAAARPERDVSEADLRERGSRTIAEADTIREEANVLRGAAAVGGGLGGVGTLIAQAQEAAAVATQAQGVLGTVQELLAQYWPALLVICGGLALWWLANRMQSHAARVAALRVEDARSGANVAR